MIYEIFLKIYEIFFTILFIICDFYSLVDDAFKYLHIYNFTFLFLVSSIVYVIYVYLADPDLNYFESLISSIHKTFWETYESDLLEDEENYIDFETRSIKSLFIFTVVLHFTFLFLYLDARCQEAYIEMLIFLTYVNWFYMFWGFFSLFCKNLKLLLKYRKNTPFIIINYLLKGFKHDFFTDKLVKIFSPLDNLLNNKLNSHYAFIWSLLFCFFYVGIREIQINYLIEAFLIIFVLVTFINLIFAILFSEALSMLISNFFTNQLLYIMLGAFFLLFISFEQYDPSFIKDVFLEGYYLFSNGSFYFKAWIVFFFLLTLILANTYVCQSINSLVELSILFSAAIPILFIIIGLVDIFAIVLSFEVLSLIIIGLCGLTMDNASTEASIKYFYQNSIITGLTLFGVFFYLFIFKNTNLLLTQAFIELLHETELLTYFFKVLLFSSIILWLLSFMFKFGIFPVNFYVADIYNGSSAPVILFISSVIKPTVLFIFATKIIPLFSFQIIVVSLFSCFCIASIILGDLMSINTNNIKRFFGHSSVSQYGFLLLSIFSQSSDVLFYAFMYVFIYNISIFIILITIIEHRSFNLVDLSNLYFNDLNLYFKYNLSLKLLITLNFLVISGVPPLILFIFKYLLFVQIFSIENYVFLLVIFIFNVGASSAYYFRIINDIWFVNVENFKFNSLSEKKSIIFGNSSLTKNSKVYIFWFLIFILFYYVFVHFDFLYDFATVSVFSDLQLSIFFITLFRLKSQNIKFYFLNTYRFIKKHLFNILSLISSKFIFISGYDPDESLRENIIVLGVELSEHFMELAELFAIYDIYKYLFVFFTLLSILFLYWICGHGEPYLHYILKAYKKKTLYHTKAIYIYMFAFAIFVFMLAFFSFFVAFVLRWAPEDDPIALITMMWSLMWTFLFVNMMKAPFCLLVAAWINFHIWNFTYLMSYEKPEYVTWIRIALWVLFGLSYLIAKIIIFAFTPIIDSNIDESELESIIFFGKIIHHHKLKDTIKLNFFYNKWFNQKLFIVFTILPFENGEPDNDIYRLITDFFASLLYTFDNIRSDFEGSDIFIMGFIFFSIISFIIFCWVCVEHKFFLKVLQKSYDQIASYKIPNITSFWVFLLMLLGVILAFVSYTVFFIIQGLFMVQQYLHLWMAIKIIVGFYTDPLFFLVMRAPVFFFVCSLFNLYFMSFLLIIRDEKGWEFASWFVRALLILWWLSYIILIIFKNFPIFG